MSNNDKTPMDAQSSGTLQSSTSHTDDSSKSTGSKGTNSSAGDTENKERDLMRDNSASPIDLECHIQEERITKIIDEALYKTKLTICLPKLVANYRILSSNLSRQHLDDLVFIFEQYDNPLFSASLLNMSALDDIRSGDVTLKNRLNPELGHLLYILNSYPSLKPTVEEMVEKMKDEYLHDEEDKSPVPMLEYLLAFERFREIMVKQMQTSAAEELAEKLYIRKMEESNAKLIAKIKEYEQTIEANQKRFETVMNGKQAVIAELQHELNLLNQAAQAKLKKKVLDSDRQMVLMHRSHAVRNEMLKEEEVETREGYNSLLHNHLVDEKNQRARRFKVETQLLSWLTKYDTEMADKQKELDELESKFKDESKKVEELEERLRIQDLEYLPLMKEREEEYHAEMTAKMKAFQIEHSARVIQNAWRQVLANRAEKRKLRKLWAKKKAEIIRQEKIEEARLRREALQAKKMAKQAKKQEKLARQAAKILEKEAAAKAKAEAAAKNDAEDDDD